MKNTSNIGIARFFAILICACLAFCACDFKQLVIRSGFIMVGEAVAAFYEEPDTTLAMEAAPANLKLVEGMARGDPQNVDIQVAAAGLFGMYAFGFLEDCCEDEIEQERSNARARGIYLRGREFAIRALQETADFEKIMKKDPLTFEKDLAQFGLKEVPQLFWAAFNWGLYINLSRDNINAVADLPKVTAMAKRVVALDERYFYGNAHLFLMVYHGSLGPAMGGDPVKTKEEYEKAWKAGNGKYLMTKYLFAKYYCLQTMNESLFKELLTQVIEAPDDLLPEQSLSNALAKEKAQRLLNRAEDIF